MLARGPLRVALADLAAGLLVHGASAKTIHVDPTTVVDHEALILAGVPPQAGHGGGFYVSFPSSLPDMHIYNSILWENYAYALTDPNDPTSVVANPDSSIEGDLAPADASLIQVYRSDVDWTPPFPGVAWPAPSSAPSNLFADPQFVSPATNDYRLKVTSPCLDGGIEFHPSWLGLPLDVLDLDDDTLTTQEFVPFDLLKFRAREVQIPSAPDWGFDGGDVPGAICDLGCHEREQ